MVTLYCYSMSDIPSQFEGLHGNFALPSGIILVQDTHILMRIKLSLGKTAKERRQIFKNGV